MGFDAISWRQKISERQAKECSDGKVSHFLVKISVKYLNNWGLFLNAFLAHSDLRDHMLFILPHY